MTRTRPASAGDARGAVPQGRGPSGAASSGLVAVLAALGVAEVAAGLLRTPSLVIAVGDTVIDQVPGSVERAAISLLGTADKPALVAGIVVVAASIGAASGVLARHRPVAASASMVGFAALGAAAAVLSSGAALLPTLIVAVVGAATGALVLLALLQLAEPPPAPHTRSTGLDRRRFLVAAGGIAVLATAAGAYGSLLGARDRLADLRRGIRLPLPRRRAGVPPAGADLGLPGLTPLLTPNEDFYRIDTALRIPPVVDLQAWRLEVRGRVDRPFSLAYDQLMDLPQVEADITLVCVSNEVNGDLVGTARWQGVPLAALLERAGLQSDADQLLGRSVDGFSAGFPAWTAVHAPGAMVAVGMNGEPLPPAHGFPARLVVPGLYGYVSATKWLSALELTGWDTEGYWVPRGWSQQGPVKTQSRIDVPAIGTVVRAGRRVVAGVAWAPTRGIEQVEVRIDDGPWVAARLAEALSVDCWRQWSTPWDATSGVHRITARATDGLGQRQAVLRTPVHPDGATGYPFLQVRVEP